MKLVRLGNDCDRDRFRVHAVESLFGLCLS
jgi:hypothetical protein